MAQTIFDKPVGTEIETINGNLAWLKESKTLFSGKTANTTVTLNESFRHFLFVTVVAQTNVEYVCYTIPTSIIQSYQNFVFCISASNGSGQKTYPVDYNSNIPFKFTDDTHCQIGAVTYNNTNWSLGVCLIIGSVRIAE